MFIKYVCSQWGILPFNELKETIKIHPGLILKHNDLVNSITKQWMEIITSLPVATDSGIEYIDKILILNTSTSNANCSNNSKKMKYMEFFFLT